MRDRNFSFIIYIYMHSAMERSKIQIFEKLQIFEKELFNNQFDPRLIPIVCYRLNTDLSPKSIFENNYDFFKSGLYQYFKDMSNIFRISDPHSKYSIEEFYRRLIDSIKTIHNETFGANTTYKYKGMSNDTRTQYPIGNQDDVNLYIESFYKIYQEVRSQTLKVNDDICEEHDKCSMIGTREMNSTISKDEIIHLNRPLTSVKFKSFCMMVPFQVQFIESYQQTFPKVATTNLECQPEKAEIKYTPPRLDFKYFTAPDEKHLEKWYQNTPFFYRYHVYSREPVSYQLHPFHSHLIILKKAKLIPIRVHDKYKWWEIDVDVIHELVRRDNGSRMRRDETTWAEVYQRILVTMIEDPKNPVTPTNSKEDKIMDLDINIQKLLQILKRWTWLNRYTMNEFKKILKEIDSLQSTEISICFVRNDKIETSSSLNLEQFGMWIYDLNDARIIEYQPKSKDHYYFSNFYSKQLKLNCICFPNVLIDIIISYLHFEPSIDFVNFVNC